MPWRALRAPCTGHRLVHVLLGASHEVKAIPVYALLTANFPCARGAVDCRRCWGLVPRQRPVCAAVELTAWPEEGPGGAPEA